MGYHYKFNQVREVCLDNLSKQHSTCSNDNCFSMRHYFLRNKEENKHIPLIQLTRMHAFLFHAVYISEFKVYHVHPRNSYLVVCYLERKQRRLEIEMNSDMIPKQIVHLCALYYGGKYIEDDDNLDIVTAIRLSDFIEQTMNEGNLDRVWDKLDTDGSDAIDEDEIERCLYLFSALFVTASAKESGCVCAPRINKMELKELMRPICDWMKRDKMKTKEIIVKDEFRSVFVAWLREYDESNGGIVANEEMQNVMLEKYKMREENEEIANAEENKVDFDRLVINCEYLQEHKSMKDVNKKDDDYDEKKHGGNEPVQREEPMTLMG